VTSPRSGPPHGWHADPPGQADTARAPAQPDTSAPPAQAETSQAPPEANTSQAPAQADTTQAPALLVVDERARRIHRPTDLLRCLVSALGILLAVGIGLLAHATAAGVEIDAVGAGKRLPDALLNLLGVAAVVALLLLPVALAIRQLSRRQSQQLGQAALTGAATIALIALVNTALRHGAATPLYDAIAPAYRGTSTTGPLDGYLAGLVAYVTIIGLNGPSRWRTALWLAIGVYGVASLTKSQATVISLVIALLLGRVVGLGVRYVAGSWSQRPSAEQIVAALRSVGQTIAVIRRTRQEGTESRHYTATPHGGGTLDIRVFDRDQEAAGAPYRFYRWLRLQGQARRGMPFSLERTVERQALLAYAADEAGVRTPRLRALTRVGADAFALANEHPLGTTLAELAAGPDGSGADDQPTNDQPTDDQPTDDQPTDDQPTDDQLGQVWDAVLRLHAHRVTHRALTKDHIMFAEDGGVVLLAPGTGDVAATDLQLRLDLAQLLAELALMVGPDRTASLAAEKASADELAAAAALLQPIALYRSTRMAVRRHKDVLPALRRQLLAATPGEDVAPVRLERVRLRTVVTLIAGLAAGYLLLGQLGRVSLLATLRSADWRWALPALALSALTYVAAAWSLSGYVADRLKFAPLALAQLAGSFVTLVTPAAVGGAALNIRYLQRRKIPAAVAAASVGLSQVVAFVMHIVLLVVFVAITGSQGHSLRPPTWVYFVIAALIAIAGVALAIPAGRRLLGARLAPVLGQVLPRLLAVVQQPRKLAEGIGGTLLLTVAYVLCLAACIRALGGSIPIASTAVVYLTGSALGSLVPTPGGIGAVEAALSAGLTAAGLPGATAVSAVLLYRTLTFWLPIPAGWGAFNYLERHKYL
jgi:glycosyltransferase 2 family protein